MCGGTSGPRVQVDLPRLFFKQHEIIGSSMGSYQEFDRLVGLMARGLPVAVDGVHPLGDYPRALARLEAGQHLGKIVIDHGGAERA